MALTYTPEKNPDFLLPTFKLKSVDGKLFSDKEFRGAKGLWVMFICNHCPYVKAIEDRLIALAQEAASWGIKTVAICSNDYADEPEDNPTELLKRWQQKNYEFPYLVDEDQVVAKEFGAVCTPDFFVFDSASKLVYRGRLDDNWRDAAKVQKRDLREVLQNLSKNQKISSEQIPSMGCSIKWKSN